MMETIYGCNLQLLQNVLRQSMCFQNKLAMRLIVLTLISTFAETKWQVFFHNFHVFFDKHIQSF
jgi:hypothetical protein